MENTKTLHGSCKCGTVKFEAEIDLSQGTGKCNCTSCWKRRWWTVRAAPEAFRTLAGADALSKEGGFCTKCGVVPYAHVPASEWNPKAYVSVNVAVLDDLDPRELMAAPITYYNGRDNDWYHKPEYLDHL
jgi:hypothetical protein